VLHTGPALYVVATGMVNQYAPHHLGRNCEEMGPILPLHALVVHQAHVGFVYQGGGLERVPWALALHVVVSQAAKLFINDWGKALERCLVAIAPGAEQPAYVVCIQFASHYRPMHQYRLIIAPAAPRKFSAVPVSKLGGILRLFGVERHMKTIYISITVATLLATMAGAQSQQLTRGNRYNSDTQPADVPISPGHSLLVYVITTGSRFGAVDLGSGVFMPMGQHTPPDVGQGLVQGPISLLTLAFSGNLDAIDSTTGKTSFVGFTGLSDCSMASSFPDPKCANVIGQLGGKFYVMDFAQRLYTVDPTGPATPVSNIPSTIPPLTFVPLSNACPQCIYDESLFSFGGKLYANFATATLTPIGPSIGTQPQLWEINTMTGQATPGPLLVNSDGSPAIGLTTIVNVNETIYAFEVATGQVVTIDMTSGRTTPVSRLHPNAGVIGGATPVQYQVPPSAQ
jgi:hypothetical protein